jgi:D-3-phosphoglycerate dehydrogenase
LDRCAEQGIVVFNTPGANANSVAELALCGMLLGSRDVLGGINWVQTIKDDGEVGKKVEKGKSKFAGNEIKGKILGLIGLGAVGGFLANAGVNLGMDVFGCDPFVSADAAWRLDPRINRVKTREEIYANCDIISLHAPLLDSTKKMINAEAISMMKDGVIILNFARDLLVDDEAMEAALKSGKVKRYITDFPNDKTAGMEGVIAIPHLGASTEEAEDNCAVMAVRQVMDYLENGNIVNSVNLPNCDMGVCNKAARITVLQKGDQAAAINGVLAQAGYLPADMATRSRGEYTYTMMDFASAVPEGVAQQLAALENVIKVRTF